MYDDEMTKTILQDLEWERENALNTGCRPEMAFTTMLIHGAADFLSNEWDGAELKHLVAALWDVLNGEMSRIEAEEESPEKLRQKVNSLQKLVEKVHIDEDVILKYYNPTIFKLNTTESIKPGIFRDVDVDTGYNPPMVTYDELSEVGVEMVAAGLPGWGSPATPSAPEPEAVASQEQNAAPEPEKPSQETDDFLNPGRAFTKNIMRDWGQL